MDGSESRTLQHVTFAPVAKGGGAGGLGSPGAVPLSQRKNSTRGGTRRLGVDDQGQYTYKNTPSSTLTASLQLGLQHAIGSIAPKPRRDILMTDFEVVDTVEFPSTGSDCTPAHKYKDFTFKTYSPEAMRFFREAFGILPEDFLLALCVNPLREVGNPGASGSLFFLSADDAFILKTVQKKEARFLQKLLPGYYLNLTQNKRTLLPKFFGLYRYKSGSVNIRIVVMNNLLPSSIRYHEKYDLKGSTFKRKANSHEVRKKSPTFKDLDFMERHEEGIILAPEKFEALVQSVDRDCKVLESFGIMDYSLLLGIHNIDLAIREKSEAVQFADASGGDSIIPDTPMPSRIELSKNFSIVSTEDIPSLLAEEQQQRTHYPEGYIQGRIHGDRVMFYLGIIDILQSYRLKKKLEHGFKSVIADGATVSVHNPSFYARRFQDFLTKQIFRKDKTKIRARKNSTNVQLRGRRQQASVPRPLIGSSERQASHDSKTSPSHEPPSYNQAMKGGGAKVSDSRLRSKTEAARPSNQVSPSSSISPNQDRHLTSPTTMLAVPPKSDTQPGSGTDLKNRDSIPDTSASTQKEEELTSGPKAGAISPPTVDHSRDEDAEGVKVQDVDIDFARNVRGTSTPIDISPVLPSKHNHTISDITELEAPISEENGIVEVEVEVSISGDDGDNGGGDGGDGGDGSDGGGDSGNDDPGKKAFKRSEAMELVEDDDNNIATDIVIDDLEKL